MSKKAITYIHLLPVAVGAFVGMSLTAYCLVNRYYPALNLPPFSLLASLGGLLCGAAGFISWLVHRSETTQSCSWGKP